VSEVKHVLEEELIQLVKKITSEKRKKQHIELKKAAGGAPSRLYNTLSSFSNQNGGGIIVFGIDEDVGYEESIYSWRTGNYDRHGESIFWNSHCNC
jgi:predicted HTH transcriptional regulator